jgi:hypothetical protein
MLQLRGVLMIRDHLLPFFIPLFAAHLVADFLIQSDQSVKQKNKVWPLIKHGLIVGLITYLFLGMVTAWDVILGIMFSHLLLDAWKTRSNQGTQLSRFVIDQLIHILIIYLISAAAGSFKYSAYTSIWMNLFGHGYLNFLTLISGGVLSIYVVSFLVEMVLASLGLKKGDDQGSGIKEGGRIIGYLERSLIFLFILIAYPAGIGFLVAAKSVFRFGELTSPDRRKQAEYIIIGTLLSIFFGTAAAVFTSELLRLISP